MNCSKKLTKNGKNRAEKRNRYRKTPLLKEKRVNRWIGRVPVWREKNSMQIKQCIFYINYSDTQIERFTCGCGIMIHSDLKRPPASPTWASV